MRECRERCESRAAALFARRRASWSARPPAPGPAGWPRQRPWLRPRRGFVGVLRPLASSHLCSLLALNNPSPHFITYDPLCDPVEPVYSPIDSPKPLDYPNKCNPPLPYAAPYDPE